MKPVSEFCSEPSRAKRGYSYHCKICKNEITHQTYVKNNPGAKRGTKRCESTFDRLRYAKQYRQDNYGQYASYAAKRKAQKINATPPWFETIEVQQLYDEAARLTELTGIPFHVDHIDPLQSEQVCGLHCLANLQILIWKDNLTKNNTFIN